ncbi:ArsR/SmtB family transcription factor [Clostridium cellulovorans]|uniref:Transcriptional regulator, ArsR family n=1 Tax=Clostridium cellulovorans (strain ATCC 35296 / DSM 3052 / OCM 3 / 743B) TaxID=573061 RepID=D9SQ59_CLOC7|nr:metalloregulator ArsR/SmtB family transcription factor [Clostridium cellulovorans]ADL50126.1 transcriptional regulator, ArsR family [Clostridium cellulovorans 743B]
MDENFQCQCNEVHSECVECVKSTMLEEKKFINLSELFKMFADPTRLKIIYALLKKELCVCDIAEVIEMSQSSVSHQLRVLKALKLVKYRKEGKVVYYSLDDEHVNNIFNFGLSHIEHQ